MLALTMHTIEFTQVCSAKYRETGSWLMVMQFIEDIAMATVAYEMP